MKYTALPYLDMVSFPWGNDLVIQKCTLLW